MTHTVGYLRNIRWRLGRESQTAPPVTEGEAAMATGPFVGTSGPADGIKTDSALGGAALPALPGYPRQVPTLAVVGAGPKGIAIAAKARALAAAGLPAPRVVLVDRGEVAGNWSGRQGYTNGLLPLGTPPEKDVGYPYAANWGDASADVVAAMAEYSWQRHLIRHGVYSDWVDRGRMRPTHRQWCAYLREVAEVAEAEIVSGVVTGLEVADGDRWEVTLEAGDAIAADGVVITGAGPAITVPGQPRDHTRVLDGRTYWLAAHELQRERALNVCVVGSGETAASVVIDLLKRCHKHSAIDVLTTRGVLYSRGESYDENRFYSDPGDWPRLAEAHRREFLDRTDRGVFSLQAEATLNQARGFRALAGRAVAVEAREQDVIVTIGYGEERERVAYDAVVVAIGFDGRWFEALLGDAASSRYQEALGGGGLERHIGLDLSVAGLAPLHLPVMAGLAQGPGFPNLSCLGLLSDRVLRRYVAVKQTGALVPERRELA
jgi:mycobactin lysine-N-oxygenase